MFALPPRLGHCPAGDEYSCFRVPFFGTAAKAYNVTGADPDGLATAQMIALARFPRCDDTTVKNPGSCSLCCTVPVPSATSAGAGDVWIFQVCSSPALLTTRQMPSEPWK